MINTSQTAYTRLATKDAVLRDVCTYHSIEGSACRHSIVQLPHSVQATVIRESP